MLSFLVLWTAVLADDLTADVGSYSAEEANEQQIPKHSWPPTSHPTSVPSVHMPDQDRFWKKLVLWLVLYTVLSAFVLFVFLRIRRVCFGIKSTTEKDVLVGASSAKISILTAR